MNTGNTEKRGKKQRSIRKRKERHRQNLMFQRLCVMMTLINVEDFGFCMFILHSLHTARPAAAVQKTQRRKDKTCAKDLQIS